MRKIVKVGQVLLGGGHPVAVQSMTNTKTLDTKATLSQIKRLEEAGCRLIRIAVCDLDEAAASRVYIKSSRVPLVADIQFDYKLAIACADIGFSGVRLNPGNIGSKAKVLEVIAACKENQVPIRVGVNMGSLEKGIEKKFGRTARALAESALYHIGILERAGFYDIIASVKASSVSDTIKANKILFERVNYPLHIGVTESGYGEKGIIKSAVGIGTLLSMGIGDTIRVSLTGDPVKEVEVAKSILAAALSENIGIEVVSCPTCSRCEVNLEEVVKEISHFIKDKNGYGRVAIMGCVVNGPGEARDADCGVAFCKENAVLFRRGKVYKTVGHLEAQKELKDLIEEVFGKI